jgi:Ca2+:H+ antiporter
MAKLNWALLKHLFYRPLSIRFREAPAIAVNHSQQTSSSSQDTQDRTPTSTHAVQNTRLTKGQASPNDAYGATVLLCTYEAAGIQYFKYTVGGVNILFVNLLPLVFFVIFDAWVLLPIAEHRKERGLPVSSLLAFFASRALIFILSLASVIPLSYFIGMAVASISAQSSIGMGAVINATFGSIIEIILYAIALTQGKGRLVEGSIVGSLLAGVLLMPGASMCSGAIKKKELKFNAKSASVTSTMLIMAIIGVLTPTLFYQTYGNFQLVCSGCPTGHPNRPTDPWTCRHCYYEHPDPISDPFYQSTVKTLMFFCASVLLFSYLIGLWFSLRTHASQIWQDPQRVMHPLDVPPPTPGRMSLYHKLMQAHLATSILPQHRLDRKGSTNTITGRDAGHSRRSHAASISSTPSLGNSQLLSGPPSPVVHRGNISFAAQQPPHTASDSEGHQKSRTTGVHTIQLPPSLTAEDFSRAAAVVAAMEQPHLHEATRARASSALEHADDGGHGGGHGGHDAPSWSRQLSASVLLGCTLLYALIAEILVDVVDVVLDGSGINEKFLGITLFALVPNTTEFMNAMSFALNGNISLSLEIGSAYALQVCLLQIPAMVAFSAWYDPAHMGSKADTFTLIFPRWDVIAIILAIFLLTYTYIEARSNYHRGTILILSYIVLTAGFYFAPNAAVEEEDFTREHFLQSVIPKTTILTTLKTFFMSLWSR